MAENAGQGKFPFRPGLPDKAANGPRGGTPRRVPRMNA
jgi:hypothetical protein